MAWIAARGDDAVWISRWPDDALRKRAVELDRIRQHRGIGGMPLFGVPCAVKDNIDVAGLATTAGCPAFRYWPDRNASCVQRLVDAGAIVVGKTNMDQFATGLTGTRSPYGAARSVFGGGLIAGGSSSGSAVAVAAGLVSFALGTDTAGSGRVPVAMNGIVGWTTFTVDEIAEEPVQRNMVLGRFTQFVNLLDLAAITVPAGQTSDGRPASVTLIGPAFCEPLLLSVATRLTDP